MEGCTHLHWAAKAMPSGGPWPRLETHWCFPMELSPLSPPPLTQSPAQIFHLLMAKWKMDSREEGIKRTK